MLHQYNFPSHVVYIVHRLGPAQTGHKQACYVIQSQEGSSACVNAEDVACAQTVMPSEAYLDFVILRNTQ